eukprot:756488-Hanusia_phi.AAC.5
MLRTKRGNNERMGSESVSEQRACAMQRQSTVEKEEADCLVANMYEGDLNPERMIGGRFKSQRQRKRVSNLTDL